MEPVERIGYCPVLDQDTHYPIDFVNTRYLSKDVSCTVPRSLSTIGRPRIWLSSLTWTRQRLTPFKVRAVTVTLSTETTCNLSTMLVHDRDESVVTFEFSVRLGYDASRWKKRNFKVDDS